MSEQAPKVDETQFNQMEVEAAAAGPEAEARRREMGEWSEAQGALAEGALKHVIESGNDAIERGATHEGVLAATRNASKGVRNGVSYDGNRVVSSVENGVKVSKTVAPQDSDPILRSPSHINEKI